MASKASILYAITVIELALVATHLWRVGDIVWTDVPYGSLMITLVMTIPILFILLHARWTLMGKRGAALLASASAIGLLFELIGTHSGVLFGGRYLYHTSGLTIGSVPILVVLYWSLFIYIGYGTTNALLYAFGVDKPEHRKKNNILLIALILWDGLTVVSIDGLLDPLQVRSGAWQWIHTGSYFGTPIGNFFGWFLITVLVTGMFRLYEYRHPQPLYPNYAALVNMPVWGYALIYGSLGVIAIITQARNILIAGSLGMVPLLMLYGVVIITQAVRRRS